MFFSGMRYPEFENILSSSRINRYLVACDGNTKKAMTLYRLNLRLSQELFTVISCFEVALRNAIDMQCQILFGNNWLKESITYNGIFNNDNCRVTVECINEVLRKNSTAYSHSKLVAELGFGFWRYFFASNNYNATGRCLLRIFPCKPHSSVVKQFNQKYIFNQLTQINYLRNRITHHEPVCFIPGYSIKSANNAREKYEIMTQLFEWMCIDKSSFLYGLDHILTTCGKIDHL